jgi:hypothetical protein
MKLVKTIAIITLSVLLAISAFFNIFITSMLEIKDVKSFKQVLLCRELMNSFGQLGNTDTTVGDSADTTIDTDVPSTEIKVPETEAPKDAQVIYNENGVKISLVSQELTLYGPKLKFFIENNTDRALTIQLTDLYIDGLQSGSVYMYCGDLSANRKAYETIDLYDYETFPSVIEFVVEISDPDTYDTIIKTDRMYLCLD